MNEYLQIIIPIFFFSIVHDNNQQVKQHAAQAGAELKAKAGETVDAGMFSVINIILCEKIINLLIS